MDYAKKKHTHNFDGARTISCRKSWHFLQTRQAQLIFPCRKTRKQYKPWASTLGQFDPSRVCSFSWKLYDFFFFNKLSNVGLRLVISPKVTWVNLTQCRAKLIGKRTVDTRGVKVFFFIFFFFYCQGRKWHLKQNFELFLGFLKNPASGVSWMWTYRKVVKRRSYHEVRMRPVTFSLKWNKNFLKSVARKNGKKNNKIKLTLAIVTRGR